MAVLSPGLQGWAAAAQIVLPQASGKAVLPGALPGGIPGALGGAGLQNGPAAVSAPGLAGVLPSVSGTLSPAIAATLSLPVAGPLLRHAASVGILYAPSLSPRSQAGSDRAISSVFTPGGSRAGLVGPARSVPAPASAVQGRSKGWSLFQALSVPSLFGGGMPSGAESAARMARQDFGVRMGGLAGAGAGSVGMPVSPALGSLSGRGVPGAPVHGPSGALAAGTQEALPGRISALRSPSAGIHGTLPEVKGRPGGSLVLHTPDGKPSVLPIFDPRGRMPGGAGMSGVSASPSPAALSSYAGDEAPRTEALRLGRPGENRRRYRSAYFPSILAGAALGVFGLLTGIPALFSAVLDWVVPSPLLQSLGAAPVAGAVETALGTAFITAGVVAALFTVYAAWELGLFLFTVAGRRSVSDREFWEFARRELRDWDLHPSVSAALLGTGPGRGLLKVYRPQSRFANLAFGFSANRAIYMRPELARSPRLFRWVLKHELAHLRSDSQRGPPSRRSSFFRFFRFIRQEFSSRIAEFVPVRSLRALRIPILERVLQESRVSLRSPTGYETLIIHPGNHEVRNPETYEELSGGRTRVVELLTRKEDSFPEGEQSFYALNDAVSPLGAAARAAAPKRADFPPDEDGIRDYLSKAENHERFRLIVFPQSFGVLPEYESPQGKHLKETLRRLDELHFLMQQLKLRGLSAFRTGTSERRQLEEFSQDILGRSMHRKSRSERKIESALQEMAFRVARSDLKGSGAAEVLQRVYFSLKHNGSVLLPFAMGERGLDTVERLLRYWRAPDGGSFRVSRVDLPEGGHVLVAHKDEPRVDLWLKPKGGGSIEESVTRLFSRTEAQQESFLRQAGFTDEEVRRFRDAGLIVKHVFSKEYGNRLFVSVRRSHAKALKRFGEEAGIQFQASRGGYNLHLIESGPMQNAPKAWKLGLTGEGGRIYDIDTGLDTEHPDFADREMESVDFVDEGPEDWVGHGTHKAGISYANGSVYRGMAPKALGRMGKVFSQSGFGANDGDIMAAAIDAMEWGADVISLSLGSPGHSDARLSEFMSHLTQKKNSKGHKPIITGSAGNSGPFNATRSQPSVGKFVASVTAAAKSLDDGDPEISFYSSVGPATYRRSSRKRVRLPMGLTALGGDVTTPPGVRDVYEHGIESVKSKDMAPSPSDASDGLHTRMSGTSMSNPMIAGFALLVKQAAERVVKPGTAAHEFFFENLPFAVNMILMRSAKDMRVPIYFQEGGFVDALAAVRLASESFGGVLSFPRRLASMVMSRFSAGVETTKTPSWDWIRRAKDIWDLEDRVFDAAEAAKTEAIDGLGSAGSEYDAPLEDPQIEALRKQEMGNAGNRAFELEFTKVRSEVLPKLLQALKDDVWLVRLYAASVLFNLKDQEALLPLAEAALGDSDARVRQAAFLAIAEVHNYAADEALKGALSDSRPDVRMYAAYALSRHGYDAGVPNIIELSRSEDKKVRFTAVWLLGQLGPRAPPGASDALAARVWEESERGNVKHVSVASLTEIASSQPGSITNQAFLTVLSAAGPQNFALTRTISKFFFAAAKAPEIRDRMRQDPLKQPLLRFIETNKDAINRPGALGQMVQLFARILEVPLDMPTPLPNAKGEGVRGVDPALGPVHILLELPEKGKGGSRIQKFQDFRGEQDRGSVAEAMGTYGLDMETLRRYDADLRVAMPISQSLWLNMPDAKVRAFAAEMERRGYRVRRASPMFRLLHETGPLSGMPQTRRSRGLSGDGVLVAYLDEGGDTKHPALAEERIVAKRNFSHDGPVDEVEDEGVSHGTHGMGIVGGTSVEGSPYVGMAPGVRFAVGKVLGRYGGSDASVMAGLEWAASLAEDPLKTPLLINLSLGGPGPVDSPINRLVNSLRLRNIGVIAATGNSGPREGTVSSPANAPLSIAVGAVDKKGELAPYSSRSRRGGDEVSWVDYGGGVFFGLPDPYEIVSALNTRLAGTMGKGPTARKWKGKALFHTMSGTSMAAPHTTGKLALLAEKMLKVMVEKLGRLPDGYLFYLEALVKRTARKVPDTGSHEVGAGLIDEEAALQALDEALEDPEDVAAESRAMVEEMRRKYDAAPPPPPGNPSSRYVPLMGLPGSLMNVMKGTLSFFLAR